MIFHHNISELQQRRMNVVLRQLQLLAEAPTHSIGSESARAKPGSKAPPVVRGRDNLYLFYLDRFMVCRSESDARFQTFCAERDLEVERTGSKVIGGSYNAAQDASRLEEEARGHVLQLTGLTSEEIAALLLATPEWVRKVRRDNRLDPDTGNPESPWQAGGTVERRTIILEMVESGKSNRAIAKTIGVDESTVRRYRK